MKAIQVDSEKHMAWSEFEQPQPGASDVLIRVHATAINRADLLQRRGGYPPPQGASPIMGLECAGEVAEVGSAVTRWSVGDRVCALLPGGGYAEYAVAHEGSVLPVPGSWSFQDAAAIPEVFATVWLNVFMEAHLEPGEKVILHAGASGVGTAGIQLCKAFGSPTFVTAGSDEKIARCIELGASGGSNRHEGPFLEAAKTFAGADGIGVILDPVGGSYLKDNMALLGMEGRLVLIGLMGGGVTEIELTTLMGKRLTLIGSTLRARSAQKKAEIMGSMEEHVWPKLAAGEIGPVIETVMEITDAEAAHDLVASNDTFGKVVMTIPGD